MNLRSGCRAPRSQIAGGIIPSISILFILVTATGAGGQELELEGRTETLPDELEGVGITERLDESLPLDARFTDDEGRQVTLAQYFDGEKPVILNLGYYACPMLCGLVANGMADALKEMDWTPGQEFRVVTLSFDPKETHTLAALKKHNYIRELERPSAAAGWHFLTGREEEIRKVTDAAGFYYKWNEKRQEYAHGAAILICTPDGRLSRYLYGVIFDPQTVRLSLVEAAEGKVGSSFDKFLLYCFHYDAEAGRYGPEARNLMKAGGAVTLLVLGGVLTGFWRRERKRSRQSA
jgi:protein SCO1/2